MQHWRLSLMTLNPGLMCCPSFWCQVRVLSLNPCLLPGQ